VANLYLVQHLESIMTPEFWIQIPILGAFIWYSLELLRRQQSALDKRDSQMQAFLQEQRQQDREAMIELGRLLKEHDERAVAAIARYEERTRPAPRKEPRK
jgi:hypothetical protein